MKRIVKKLLKAMRAFLARIGVTSWAPSPREEYRVQNSQSVPSPLNDVREQKETCKAEKPQSIEPCLENGLSVPVSEEAALVTKHEIMNDAVAVLEESPTPVKLDVSKVPALNTASIQDPKSDDVSLGIKQTPVVDDVDLNSDLGIHESGEDTIDSQTEMHPNSRDTYEALGDTALTQSNEAMADQPPSNEISIRATSMQKLLGSHSKQNEGYVAVTAPEEDYVGSMASDKEEVHHIRQQNPCPEPPRKEEIHPTQAKKDLSTNIFEPDLIDANLKIKTPLDVGPEDQQGHQEDFPASAATVPEGKQVAQESKELGFLVPEHELTTASEIEEPHLRDITLRRPTPLEDTSEYEVVVPDLSAVKQEYARWNKVIVEELLLARSSEESVYLCVNPRILAKIYEEAGFDMLTPDQAKRRFSAATAQMYQKRVLKHKSSLRILRRYGDDGSPDCVAFLAASVLAAYHMQTDIEVSSNAYYRRLADLLECEIKRVYPVGFKPAIFESLWTFLHDWLHKKHEKKLALPKDRSEHRRFIALPLAHVPLRSLDIEKLPAFFKWAKYPPGGRIQHAQLLANLQRWQQSRNILTPTGASALSDDRSDAVLAQVSAELESWDGNLSESSSGHSALVEIHLDIVQRNPVLSYLPRRPLGFPEIFESENCAFEASGEGCYDRTEISVADGPLLGSGFKWHSRVNGIQFTLRRPKASVIAFVPSSDHSGFLSSNHLLRGVKCAVLCREEVINKVEEYISKVAQQRLNAKPHSKLPNGWLMIRDIKALVHIETPAGLEVLRVDQNITFTVTGGLRIGRQWSWLAGSPPRVLVSGIKTSDQVKINNTPVQVDANGELLADRMLAKSGRYLIEAGSSRRQIEIIKPSISTQPPTKKTTDADQNVRIALPQGSWKLLGRSPEQISSFQGEVLQGTLASCLFHPVWAIQVGAGPGARVAALMKKPLPPMKLDHLKTKNCLPSFFAQWVMVIYETHIRRPILVQVNGIIPDENIKLAWEQYVTAAKQIKRILKKTK